MQNILLKKALIFGILVLFISSTFATSTNVNTTKDIVEEDTEYWALLIAVGVYADHPDQDRPSMLTQVENLHNMLLVSEHWNEDHIKVIKAENATMWNIYKGLRWLNKMDDKDDFSLVYITTHGGQLPRDIWPRDEADGMDEVLASYRGFQFSWANIRDDVLNLMLSFLSAKGTCVVVDSCYAGGFNDPPYFTGFMRNKRVTNQISAYEWMQELGEELQGKGRVVLMSCREDELSYGSKFTKLLIKSLRGYADTNEDGMCSAEEAYQYVKDNMPGSTMHPTIFDNFPGDLPLTENEFPPSVPETPIGQTLGDTNTTYNYSTVSIDPEGGKISYGWDWDGDFTVDEWTIPLDCNTTVNISYSWTVEGTYNIRVRAKDDHGVLSSDWSNHTVVIMCDDNIPDQQQTNIGGCTNLNQWVAQSFVPSLDTLSKVELVLESWERSGDPPPLHLYIRENLSDDNLAESSRVIPIMDYDTYAWFTFDFENLDVVPGKTYYIVCEQKEWWPSWLYWYSDCYSQGEVFMSEDGIHWSVFIPSVDCCFVTWGKI